MGQEGRRRSCGTHSRVRPLQEKKDWGQGCRRGRNCKDLEAFIDGPPPPARVGRERQKKKEAGFIPRAILAFLWNPLSGATPFRKKNHWPRGDLSSPRTRSGHKEVVCDLLLTKKATRCGPR